MPTFTPSPPTTPGDGEPKGIPSSAKRAMKPDSSTPASQRQATLFELRFGPRRDKSWGAATVLADAKRLPEKDAKEGGAGVKEEKKDRVGPADHPSEEGSRKRVRMEGTSKLPISTSSDSSSSFLQVTRPAFIERYAVSGLPDAEVYYLPGWVDGRTAEAWRRELDDLPHWYRPKLKVYGREITQSRSIAAVSTEPGLELKYSGHPVEMHAPFPPLLDEIAKRLCSDECLGSEVRFNHAMLNRYEDGSIYIGKHSDNLENRVIVTVSLGADRSWIMERRKPRGAAKGGESAPKKRWTLANGSVLVMQGDTQRLYTHEIPKELRIKHPRISITFRQLVYD